MFVVLSQNTGGTAVGGTQPIFSLPFADLGAGEVSLVAQGVGSTTATFTRASTAYALLSNGLYGLVDSGTPRSQYSPAGVYLGYLAEGARSDVLGTTAAIRRTMTDAGWVNTTMTVGAATGVDGVASAGASLTAGGANSTSLFTTVLGAAIRTYGVWARRKTGNGTVQITVDGSAFTTITLTPNYQLFQLTSANVANQVVGFKIVTDTDAIEVDFNTLEAAAFANPTPIPVNVSKAADILTYVGASNINPVMGSVYLEHSVLNIIDSTGPVAFEAAKSDGSDSVYIGQRLTTTTERSIVVTLGGSAAITVNTIPAISVGDIIKVAGSWGGGNQTGSIDGLTAVNTADSSPTTLTLIYVGARYSSTQPLYSTVRNLRIYPIALTASQLQAITT